ncbi:MAG: Holliday junction resolvase RuvX [Spirochaetota bacterium]
MGRILCLDYGDVRIGVAVSDPTETIASAKKYIKGNVDNYIDNIISIIKELNIEKLVIGLPLNLKGRNSQKTKEVKNFYNKMKELLDIPVELWDERFSTLTAEQHLREANIKGKKQRELVDSLAAQIILQNYLDSKKYK